MRHATLIGTMLLLALGQTISAQMSSPAAKADIYNPQGEKIGAATLSQVESGVRVALDVSKLARLNVPGGNIRNIAMNAATNQA